MKSRNYCVPSHGATPLLAKRDVFHAPAVEEAVDQQRQPLYMRPPAGSATIVEDDRPGDVFGQFSLDLPHQLLALFRVGLARLPIDQLVNLGAAVAIIVQLAAAPVEQAENLVGVVARWGRR